jgi:hypothetical protein
MVQRNQGSELERAWPVINNFFLSLYFAFTQIVKDARSNKQAHVTMSYYKFLRIFEVEVLFVHCLDNIF